MLRTQPDRAAWDAHPWSGVAPIRCVDGVVCGRQEREKKARMFLGAGCVPRLESSNENAQSVTAYEGPKVHGMAENSNRPANKAAAAESRPGFTTTKNQR